MSEEQTPYLTDFDRRLIEKARALSKWHYRDIKVMIDIADTDDARSLLRQIAQEKQDLIYDTL